MRQRIHLNWGACADWNGARARLSVLRCTLYGNFADIEGDPTRIKAAIKRAGFQVSVDKRDHHTYFQLSDLPPPLVDIRRNK